MLIIILFINSTIVWGQIKNSSFEISNDSIDYLPQNWKTKKIDSYEISLDKKIKQEGLNSLRIKSSEKDLTVFMPFSQIIEVKVDKLKKIAITFYAKTDNVLGNANVWCQILNKDNKMIGFNSLTSQNIFINGTNDWKRYSLVITITSDCKKIGFGGLLSGFGTVWFDNFHIEDVIAKTKHPSRKVKKYVHNFCSIIKNNSVYSDSLSWNTIDQEINYLTMGMTTIQDTQPVLEYLLSKLREKGDCHSFLLEKVEAEKLKSNIIDERQPIARMLENNIGYINIPGFVSLNDTISIRFANKIQFLIKELDAKNEIKGWAIDLRENTGGNMFPMIIGLGPLINNGTLGHFINPKNRLSEKWYYQDGACGQGNKVWGKIKEPYYTKKNNLKIAILIGPNTGSSGEMLAISFIGKANAKLFGQPSAGLTTANLEFNLSDGKCLILATGFVSDRNNKIYLGKITPDVLVSDKDDVIKVAELWLSE